MGRSGILNQGELRKDSDPKIWTTPPIPATNAMKPECTLIVYYFQPDGEVIFNQKRITFEGFSSYNVSV